jgi:hypothetical protein
MSLLVGSDRWISQSVAGGHDLPPEERGDCVGACLASLLAQPLSAISNYHGDDWWNQLQAEVGKFGYWIAHLQSGHGWPRGLWVAVVPSLNFEGSTHVIVCRGSKVVHDPAPTNRREVGARVENVIEMWALVPLDPAVGETFGPLRPHQAASGHSTSCIASNTLPGDKCEM